MQYKCPKCNAENKKDAKFCSECGLSLFYEDVPTELKALTPGAILANRYEIIKRIKSGGMGSVYKTKHVSLGKIYAVKELLNLSMDKQEQKEAIQRFEGEARILSELTHPNMPSVSDYFSIGGRYYLVMDFIEGKDLSTILLEKGTPGLSEAEVVDWCVQICDVLSYLHTRVPPIIYRDIKPSNIMIRENDNKAILIDFGIARTLQTESEISQTKTAIGTAGYMSPEQYRGKPLPKSDIYSLGATMYHLLTGNQPIPFTFPSLIKERPDLSEEINAIVMTSLRLKPDERFKSALEMKKALMGMIKVALPMTEEPDKIDLLLLQLNVPDVNIRKFSVKTLGEIKTEKAIKPLLNVIKKDDNPEIRKIAIESLLKFKLEAQIEEKLKDVLLHDTNPLVRGSAAQVMSSYNDKTFTGPLILALDDSADEVKQRAIIALGKLNDQRALKPLYNIFQKEEGMLKEEAIVAIESISPEYIREWREKEKEKLQTQQNKKTILTMISMALLLLVGLVLFKVIGNSYLLQSTKEHLKKGFNYVKVEKMEQARKEFEEVLHISSNDANAFYGIGLTYMSQDTTKAMENMEKAIKLNKDFPWTYLYMGNLYLQMQKPDYVKAIDYLEKAKKLMPNVPQTYMSLGQAYYTSGETEKAKSLFEECKTKFPQMGNDDNLKRWLAILNKNTTYQNPASTNEANLLNDGLTFLNQKNYPKAIEYFEKVLSINPKNVDAYYALGMSYSGKDKQKANDYFLKALEYNPQYTQAIVALAEMYYDMNNYNETINYCKKGIDVSPQNGKLYLLQGLSYYNLGNKPEALSSLSRYLEIEPNGRNVDTVKKLISQINGGG